MFKLKKQKLEAQIADLKNSIRDLQNNFLSLQEEIWKLQKKDRAIANETSKISTDVAGYKANNDLAVMTVNNDITDSQEAISDLTEMSDSNSSDITDCQEAISELMEIIEGSEE